MARLYRPTIPVEVKCRVALRQLNWPDPDKTIEARRGSLGALLTTLLLRISTQMRCDCAELRLDHDPPLGARAKSKWATDGKTHYIPEANSPAHLAYRPHGPQHAGSHLIKTNTRGDHGQHPDRVLIKKARRLERGPRPKRGPKIRSRGFDKVKRPFPKRSFK